MVKLVFGDNGSERPREDEELQGEKLQVTLENMPKIKAVHISETQREAYLKAYDCVVTHDFGDEYHLTEEERKKKNQYYEVFKPIRKMRHTIRKIDEYVIAMRQILHCIDVIAENNGLYDPQEFKKMVMKGEVKIFGLSFPKYKGKNRKTLSAEYLTEFILSDKDPKELMMNSNNVTTIASKEHIRNTLFTPEELKNLTDTIRSDREEYVNPDECWIVEGLSKKKNSALVRNSPEIVSAAKAIKRQSSEKSNMDRLIYDMSVTDISKIQQYDMARGYRRGNSDKIPKYKGGSVDKYIAELDDYERTQIKFNYHGKMLSIEEIEEIELKDMLSDSGWNIMAFATNRDETKKLKKIRKADEKRCRKLKAKLDSTTKRLERTTGALAIRKKKKKKNKKKGGDD